MLPRNLLGEKVQADYLVTGLWSERAQLEAEKYCITHLACDGKREDFTTIPGSSQWALDPEAAYVHYCANETMNGVEFHFTPEVGDVPLVADMTSNLMSRPVEVRRHACIYASGQSNLGPGGISLALVHQDVTAGQRELEICPTYCSWKTCADAGSMHSTPPTLAVYALGLCAKYTKQAGGLAHWAEASERKSKLIYDVIDGSDGFYTCPVEKSARSRMNVRFTIGAGDENLDKKFITAAQKANLYNLAAHESIGGCCVSLCNGIPLEGVEALATHMTSFMDEVAE